MIENTINDDVTIAGRASVLASRYRIVKQLGVGGMGSVWLAADTQLDGKLFAIKMLPSILVANKRAYNQLKAEALVAMKLVHPNIVQIRAFEENNGNPFLVMDYIDGETLDEWLGDRGQELGVSEEEVVKLLKPIAEALDYAHGEGVIHRDIKPANVIIRKDGRPFVLDFGIAREIQETLTRVTGKMSSGTLMYMSPEQLNGDMPKKEQDIYSFAAMVYECLKGEPPFCRGAIEDQIKNKEPEPLVGRGVPNAPNGGGLGTDRPTIADAVMRGLAKKPNDRPKSCVAMLEKKFNRVDRADRAESEGRLSEERSSGGRASPRAVIFAVFTLLLAFVGAGVWFWKTTTSVPMKIPAHVELRPPVDTVREEARSSRDAQAESDRKAAEEFRIAEEKAKVDLERKQKERMRIAAKKAEAERKANLVAKAAATDIRIEAKVQRGKVEKILDDDGFGSRKEALFEEFIRADALFDEKVCRWNESAQTFSNYVEHCKALIKLDGERKEAIRSRVQAQEAFRKTDAKEAEKFTSVDWKAAVKVWERASAEFGRAEFSAARDSFAAAAVQFNKCGEKVREHRNKITEKVSPYSLDMHLQRRVAKDSGTRYLQGALMPFVRNGSLPGAIGVLYKNGLQETTCIGWANVEKHIPMSMDKTFMICSQSKSFCGICIAMLVEEGRIDIDDPVSKYLPQFSSMAVERKDSRNNSLGRYIAKRTISIRHLLTNCAGFPFDVPTRKEKGWTSCSVSKVVEEAALQSLVAEPGTKWMYSNVGFEVAAAIVEVVSGMKYESFLKERVLNPLGMKDTTFNPTDEQLSRQVAMYKISKTDPPEYCASNKWMPLPHNGRSVYVSASCGLWSTANDMLKFCKMLMFGGIGENGVRILKEKTVRELLTVSQIKEVSTSVRYSLGLNILQDGWFGHGGAWGTHFVVNIDKQEIIIKVVQLVGGPRPWDRKWQEASDSFFSAM